jgi:hypothetical protein
MVRTLTGCKSTLTRVIEMRKGHRWASCASVGGDAGGAGW